MALQKGIVVITAVVILCVSEHTSSGKHCKLSCTRLENDILYGFDANSKDVTIDIGKCQETYDDVQDCDMREPANGECFRRCEPKSYLAISTSNRSGPFVVNAIKTCYATRQHCTDCQRKPSIVYVFPASKYRTRVDVGKCVGKCANGSQNGCMPVKTKTVAVEGPNGPIILNTIEQCSCESPVCYRGDFFESFSELVITGNTTKRKDKVLNVGRCIGNCTGVQLPGTCYPSEDNCLLYVQPRQAKCVPTGGGETTFTDIHGVVQAVTTVTECGCSTG